MKDKVFINFLLFYILLFFTFSCPPCFAGVLVTNGLTHIHNITGGTKITGSIKLRNEGEKEGRIIIYQKDLILSCSEEEPNYQDIGKNSNSLGNWLQTNVNEKVMQANEEFELIYSIDVPAGAIENGTYWSLIMVEMTDQLQIEKREKVTVQSKVRYGIQILANIGAVESPKIFFEKIANKQKDVSTKIIQVKLRNEGIFLATVKISLDIFDDRGVKVNVVDGAQKKVYPMHCNDFELELKNLPKGKYNGILVADNGEELYGENIDIEIM